MWMRESFFFLITRVCMTQGNGQTLCWGQLWLCCPGEWRLWFEWLKERSVLDIYRMVRLSLLKMILLRPCEQKETVKDSGSLVCCNLFPNRKITITKIMHQNQNVTIYINTLCICYVLSRLCSNFTYQTKLDQVLK